MFRPLFIPILLLAAPVAAEGEDGEAKQADADMAEATVVVTGTREKQRIIEMPRAVETTDRRTIEQQGTMDVAEALAALPGVSIQELSPGGAAPVLRGLAGPDTLILVDGMDFSTPILAPGPNNLISTIGLFSVERLEVIRGGSSVLSGAGGMGGVINVLTRDLEQPDQRWWRWREFFGFHGENRYNFTSVFKRKKEGERFSALLAAQRDKFRSRNIGGLYQGAEDTWQPLSDRGQWDWLAKARYGGDRYSLTAGYLGMQVKGGGRLDLLDEGRVSRAHQTEHFSWLKYKGSGGRLLAHRSFHFAWRASEREGVEARCEGYELRQVVNERRCWNRVMPEEDQDKNLAIIPIPSLLKSEHSALTEGWQLGFSGRFRDWGRLRSRMGILVKDDSLLRSTRSQFGADAAQASPSPHLPPGSKQGRLAAFVHGRLAVAQWAKESPFPRRLDLRGGIRAVEHRTEIVASEHPVGAHQHRDAGLVGELQLVFLRQGRGSTWLGWSQGFRAPNLAERYFEGSDGELNWLMNEDLGPQRSNTFDLGSRRKSRRWTYSWSFYHSQINDLFDAVNVNSPSGPSFRFINAPRASFTGFDISLLLKGMAYHHLHQASWVTGQVLPAGSDDAVPSRYLPPVQGRHLFHLGPARADHGFELWIDWALAQDKVHPIDQQLRRYCGLGQVAGADCSGTPAWWTLGTRWVWKYSGRARIGLRADNLLDRRYRRHGSGAHASGLDLRTEVEVEF